MEKRFLWTLLAFGAFSGPVLAGTDEWTSGWASGTTEYAVDDGNRNSLLVSCPDYQDGSSTGGYVSATAMVEGKNYDSDTLSGGKGFDVIIDGEVYNNPFDTDCRVCGDLFPGFWQALRQANNLYISAGGIRSRLSTNNIESVIVPLDSPQNSCISAW